ncbi:hypothetical protein Mapa_001806 [Marchantia paleacea]|nr:hypothetical protein Mapa_001806 [Marchantia paleacea]
MEAKSRLFFPPGARCKLVNCSSRRMSSRRAFGFPRLVARWFEAGSTRGKNRMRS